MLRKGLTIILFALTAIVATAQTKTVRGTVMEASIGEPAIGVNVHVKGTTIGTITSIDGTYELKDVPANAVLVFSYIGMKTQEKPVAANGVVNVTMQEDAQHLEEVVVVGYGTSKLKDLTSPIAVVKAEELTKHTATNPMQAMQGKVAGVQVVSNGEPGAGPKVRVRGVGSFNSDYESPLYVVDGMFYDNIDFLSTSDIEDISVLKDASASAIYGVRAANGVILVTTKKGTINRPATITYDGYFGIQTATNVMKMANSEQYSIITYEKGSAPEIDRLKKSIDNWGAASRKVTVNGKQYDVPLVSTNWYNELLRTAPMHSHNVDLSGGTDKVVYTIGVNYLNQEGVMNVKNGYDRLNVRTKTDYKPFEWLKVGVSIVLSNSTRNLPNNEAWFKAYVAPSIFPAYDDNNKEASPINFGSVASVGLSEYFANPLATATYYNNEIKTTQILPSYYAEIDFMKENKLKFKTSLSQDLSFNRGRNYVPEYTVGGNQKVTKSTFTREHNDYSKYIWDNTLTYRDTFSEDHNFSAMLGHSVRSESWRMLKGWANGVPNQDEYWYIDKGDAGTRLSTDNGTTYNGLSFFGRATYDYKGKYLLAATFRADGTSKYQQKWGYYPSVGAAWVLSEENFMKNQKIFNFAKLRASWGKLGNDKIQPSDGFASIVTGNGSSGIFGDVMIPGYTNVSYFSHLKWEEVSEWNAGADLAFLNSRLGVEIDWYRRVTNNAVMPAALPMGVGTLSRNYGSVLNTGVEFAINWSDKLSKDFSYYASINGATLKNKVLDLGADPYLLTGSAEFRAISRVGDPINSYYGYKMIGVYQNQAQVDADPIAKANGLVPGDLRYEDVNNDKMINEKDRQVLGSVLPTFTFGGSAGFNYKNVDFGLTFNGVAGNKIVNQKRGVRRWQGEINYDVNFFENRWTGEGTSNTQPSSAGSVKPWNVANFSSYLVENGSFFRIQNIQVGYTFQDIIPGDSRKTSLRLSLTAERPFTFYKYNGFTPEVSGGFDTQVYPLASSYSFGVKLIY